jgi:hypothetical protein
MIIAISSIRKKLEQLHDDMTVRANQEVALELIKKPS